jgi:hypothetical protein
MLIEFCHGKREKSEGKANIASHSDSFKRKRIIPNTIMIILKCV